MYKITCDGYPLLDTRVDELILTNPKVKVEVNTVGEGSFEIYSNHPNFDKLKMLKSIFEVSDEYGVVFRGRMTELSEDFWNGKAVDLEGVLGFFNDSIVRPYNFPEDFFKDTGYEDAYYSGNVVEYFLGWLIENHNSQVEEFQRFKLGVVTVSDPNNYITRSDSDYKSTWEILKEKLFESSLGGKLCIRYEADGNYIDYLSEFTETNTQGIEYGSNLLDLMHDTSATATYSAIIPLGAKSGDDADALRWTLEDLPDGDIDDDLVKSGDTIYSRAAVAAFGWIYAPIEDTTWDDVTDPVNLRRKGVEWLTGTGIKFTDTVELSAADLHFSDSEIRSFRIYKKIPVYSAPHSILNNYDLTKLDLDLLNPQNTKITVGETKLTLTDLNGKYQSTIKKFKSEAQAIESLNYEILETKLQIQKTESSILLKVEGDYTKKDEFSTFSKHTEASLELKVGKDENDQIVSMLNASADVITLNSNRLIINSDNFALSADGTITAEAGKIGGCEIRGGKLVIPAAHIEGTLSAEQITVEAIEAVEGTIGGWLIDDSFIGSSQTGGSMYIASADDNVDYWIRAHNAANGGGDMTFSVGKDGILYARGADIEGHITATSGEIGGCEIVDGVLSVPAANIDGVLTAEQINADGIEAENVKISGDITASEGQIGGFSLVDSVLSQMSESVDDISKRWSFVNLDANEKLIEVGSASITVYNDPNYRNADITDATHKSVAQLYNGEFVLQTTGGGGVPITIMRVETSSKTYEVRINTSDNTLYVY